MAAAPRLGIDFGTSHTVALLAHPDGRVRPLLFDGSPLLPSAVYANTDGRLLVGRDAVHAARVDPARFEASPKRRIDHGTVLLGDREFPVAELIAGVLSHVADEARRVGGSPSEVTLTHPASWGVSRRLALIEGAKAAGLGRPRLIPEPVAAAHYFADVLGHGFTPGQGLLVYDFGGGTFDASMVVRGPQGFDVRAVDGIDDLGGVDLDQLIVDYVRAQSPDDAVWKRLTGPETTEDRRHRRVLWDDARIAKEMLSRSASATVHVPLLGTDVIVTRDSFEQLARPMLEQTVRTTVAVSRWAAQDRADLAGIFLVGGSSRIPLVATLLHRELGIAPTVIEQPEIVVGEGSLRADRPPSPAGAPPSIPAETTVRLSQLQPGTRPIGAQADQPVLPLGGQAAGWASGQPSSATPVSPAHTPPGAVAPVSATPVSAAPVSAAPVSPSPVMPVSPSPAYQPAPPRPPVRSDSPVWPAGTYQAAPQRPVYQQGGPSPGPPRSADRPPRRWLAPVLSGLFVLALAVTVAVVMWPRPDRNDDPADLSRSATLPAAYERANRPTWVPANFTVVDRRAVEELWVSQDESEGGTCNASGDAMSIRRETSGIVGCTLKPPFDTRQFTDVALEAEITVNSGCAGFWARTGNRGYVLLTCAKQIRLHRVGNERPSAQNMLGEWPLSAPRPGMVVGLLALGPQLSVYVDDKPLGPPVNNSEINSGKVNAGAYTGDGNGNGTSVVIEDFRVFSVPTAASTATANTPTRQVTPSVSPSRSSGSTSPSPSRTRSATPAPTPTAG